MPAGHHLVYFPSQIPLSQLLPDGTDHLHSPGGPFTRRLWAGGRVRFSGSRNLSLRGDRAVCLETIRDVEVKGKAPDEKVVVRIERRMGTVDEGESDDGVRSRLFPNADEEYLGDASIVEDRNIVFMRGKTPEQVSHDQEHFGMEDRVIRGALLLSLVDTPTIC
jgi:hydroxyacyl-ACP dehydratase HTD2-like protein with hotdog domain